MEPRPVMQRVERFVSNIFRLDSRKSASQSAEPPPMQTYYEFESSIRTDRIDKALDLITKLAEDETATGLWYAAFYGRDRLIPPLVTRLKDFGTIEDFLINNIMVNQSISVAAEKGMLGAIKLLMGYGASLETRNSDEMTPLHCASAHNHAETVRFCLEEKVERNARDRSGNLALHLAAKQQTEATVMVLCTFSPLEELNAQNDSGYTPLDEAFKNCSLTVAEYLWRQGAKINNAKKIMQRDRTGMTALHMSVRAGKCDLVKFLCENKVHLNTKDANGNTSLHIAARYNHEEIVGILLGADVELEARNEQGNTALMIARHHQYDACADIIARATNRKLVSVYGVCACEDITIGIGGAPGAGKTTFVGSFRRSYFWSIFSNESPQDKGDKELSSRTRGIRVERIKDPLGSPNIYHFLDFGGHQEYIPSHSLFISESTTPAMAICLVNATKPLETLMDEIELWCGVFISCHRLKEEQPEKKEDEDEEESEEDSDYDSDTDRYPPREPRKQKKTAKKAAAAATAADENEDSTDADNEGDGARDAEKEQKSAPAAKKDGAPASAAAAADADADADTAEGEEKEEGKEGDKKPTPEDKDKAPLKMPFLLLASRLDSQQNTGQTEVVLRAYGRIVQKFRHRLAFEAEPIFLDARKSQAGPLKDVRQHVHRLSCHLLRHTDKTPRLIHAVRKVLPDVRRKIGRPFTDRETFKETLLTVLENQKAGMRIRTGVEMLIDAVLQLLSCCGEVVVFNSTEDLHHVVVLKADWLLTTIVGHLCSPKYFPSTLVDFDGARADKKRVEKVLSSCGGRGNVILKMLESIGICIVDGEDVILPSKLAEHKLKEESQIGLWKQEPRLTTYSGIFYKCDEGIPISPGVAPLIQIRVFNQFLKAHGTRSYLWRRGIRVQPYGSEVQGTIVVAPSRLGVYVACRGPVNSQRHQYALIQILSKILLAVIDRVSPGSNVHKLLLSPNELSRLVNTQSADFPQVFYKPRKAASLMESGQQIIMDPETTARLGITDSVIDLLHLPDSHVHLMSQEGRRQLVELLGQPNSRYPQYKTWDYLAAKLGFSRLEIEHTATLPNPVDIVLDGWARKGYSSSISELRRLCSDVNYDVSRVLEEEMLKPFYGESNVFTAQRHYDTHTHSRRQHLANMRRMSEEARMDKEKQKEERQKASGKSDEGDAEAAAAAASNDTTEGSAKRCVQFGDAPQVLTYDAGTPQDPTDEEMRCGGQSEDAQLHGGTQDTSEKVASDDAAGTGDVAQSTDDVAKASNDITKSSSDVASTDDDAGTGASSAAVHTGASPSATGGGDTEPRIRGILKTSSRRNQSDTQANNEEPTSDYDAEEEDDGVDDNDSDDNDDKDDDKDDNDDDMLQHDSTHSTVDGSPPAEEPSGTCQRHG